MVRSLQYLQVVEGGTVSPRMAGGRYFGIHYPISLLAKNHEQVLLPQDLDFARTISKAWTHKTRACDPQALGSPKSDKAMEFILL
jgi:hypothetical protein